MTSPSHYLQRAFSPVKSKQVNTEGTKVKRAKEVWKQYPENGKQKWNDGGVQRFKPSEVFHRPLKHLFVYFAMPPTALEKVNHMDPLNIKWTLTAF